MEASASQVQAWLDLGLPQSPEEPSDSPQAARCKRWWARQLQSFNAWQQSTDVDATTLIHISDDETEPASSPPPTATSAASGSASAHSPFPSSSPTPSGASWSPHCLRTAAERCAAAEAVSVEEPLEDVLPADPVRERTPPPPRRFKWGSCPKRAGRAVLQCNAWWRYDEAGRRRCWGSLEFPWQRYGEAPDF
ncbi:unnamed protein product [Symbiodinium sp. CCMP2592]|nr:unnamed protein product [Symbiodinium sp. CCMP2592]